MSVSVYLKEGFLESKEYRIMKRIEKTLATGTKTFEQLYKELKEPKTSVYFALRSLIRWKVVYAFIDNQTLEKTKGKFMPFYNLTGINPIMHGGGLSDKSTICAVLELDDKGNEIGRQRYKRIRSRLGSRYEYVDRRVGKFQRKKEKSQRELADEVYKKAFEPQLPRTDFRKEYFRKKILEQHERARQSSRK